MHWSIWGSNLVRGKRFFSFSKRLDRLWDPSSLLYSAQRSSFLGLKRPGRDVAHSPPFSSEVTNERRYISTPPICLKGVEGTILLFFTFALLSNINKVLCFTVHFTIFTVLQKPKLTIQKKKVLKRIMEFMLTSS